MQEALCQYATRAAEKLRNERQFCQRISVFIRTSPHSQGEIFYGNSAGESLTIPTQATRDMIGVAMLSLDRIWLKGQSLWTGTLNISADWVIVVSITPYPRIYVSSSCISINTSALKGG